MVELSNLYLVMFSPDGGRVFVVGPNGKRLRFGNEEVVTVWDVAKREIITTHPVILPRFDRITPLPGGRHGVTTAPLTGNPLGIVDVKDCRPVALIGVEYGHMHPAIPTPDGKSLVGGSESRYLDIIKVEDILKLIPEAKPERKP